MTAPNMTSVRLTILEAIETFFINQVTATLPTDDPYGITFSTVAMGPLGTWDNRKRYSLGIAVGPEVEKFSMPYIMCWMTVNMEFRLTVNADDAAPGVMIEQLLTVVKRAMTADRTWGGKAIDTKVKGSEIDLVTYADRQAIGVCICEVQYRYSHLDPRNPLPDM